MHTWLTILVSCPLPTPPISLTDLAYASITGATRSKSFASPPAMTVSWPFSAPAWPPLTGASTKPMPADAATSASSRASSAEAVV